MSFISYNDDEVRVFHPFFETIASEVLREEGLDNKYQFIHHPRQPGTPLVPDFVLIEKDTNRWVLAIEVKRTPTSVHSTRNQIQTQGYVIENANLFRLRKPHFFAITNLEELLLFAQQNGQPPRYCRIENGAFCVGRFSEMDKEEFCVGMKEYLKEILSIVLSDREPQFDIVWPQIIEDFVSFTLEGVWAPELSSGTNSPNWQIVRDFFCFPENQERLQIFLLRCLLADYLRGILDKNAHPNRALLSPLVSESLTRLPNRLARIFDNIRRVDFSQLFEMEAINEYRELANGETQELLLNYVNRIIESRVYNQALERLDTIELIDGMLSGTHPDIDLAQRGKIRTDPELAILLS
ncbi:MAG: BpuSI family type II restriction endonuclease, partial [Candidatus Hodarchaeota archaeon]